MKKRILAVIAAVVLAASVSGCKGKEPANNVGNAVSNSTESKFDKTFVNPGEKFPELPELTTPDHVFMLKDKVKFVERTENTYTYDFGTMEESSNNVFIFSSWMYSEGFDIKESNRVENENALIYDIIKIDGSEPLGMLAIGESADTGNIIGLFTFFKN